MPEAADQTGAEALLGNTFESLLFGRVAGEDLTGFAPGALGRIAAAALQRFQNRTPGVADKLGPAEFASGLSVPKDVSRAKRMSLLVERAYAQMPIRNLPKILGQDQSDAFNEQAGHLDADTSESTPDAKIEKPTQANPGNQPTPPSTPPPGPL